LFALTNLLLMQPMGVNLNSTKMADINIQDLATLSPSAIDSNYYGLVFESNGDTNKVVFEDAVAQANANNGCVCLQEATLTIATADVLQLNSTPLTIVAAQGAGTAIEVISASLQIDFNTTAYATNTTITLISSGATDPQADNSIDATVARIGRFRNRHTSGASATATQLIENADLLVTVETGDPTAGDSDITVSVLYRVITL